MGKINILLNSMRSGELNPTDYLNSLEAAFVEWEPVIFSFVPEPRRWERVHREAAELAARYPDPKTRPPLYGLPVGVKDIFRVDGLPTRAGSRLSNETLSAPESVAVSQLRAAGAIILGKTITTEFAYFGPGPTRNPHNPFHTPGGSSSGSAAAVAAGLCPTALGTQTIGSVNRPAAFCGIVGYKPTYNRISKEHVIENATSHDHVGLFLPDVESGLPLAATLCANWNPLPAGSLGDAVLGVPEGPYLHAAEPEMLTHYYKTVERLEAAGYTIKRIQAMPDFDYIHYQHLVVNERDAADYHAQFEDHFHFYHPKTLELVEKGRARSDEELATGRKNKQMLREHLTTLMDEHQLDAWITPGATGPAPRGYASTGNPIMQLPWTNSGLPTLNMRSGTAENGLPLSLQLATRADQDEVLFSIGVGIEELLSQ